MMMRGVLYLLALILSLHCVFVVGADDSADPEGSHPLGQETRQAQQTQRLGSEGNVCPQDNTDTSCKTTGVELNTSPANCGDLAEKKDCTTIVPKTESTCSKASEGSDDGSPCPFAGSPPPPPPTVNPDSDDTSCKDGTGVPTKGPCPPNTKIAGGAGGAGGADSGTLQRPQGPAPGGDGEREKQRQLESQREANDDAVSGPPGTSHGKGQAASQPAVKAPDNNQRGHDNVNSVDQDVRTEETTPVQVISEGADQNNGNQQPGGNGS
ncbi:uncharacterized protein TM35_000641020, partial [Trypanosoma theileri]